MPAHPTDLQAVSSRWVGLRRVVRRTVTKTWDDDILAHAAQAAFWQALSLGPLLLGLLASLGPLSRTFGPRVVEVVQGAVIDLTSAVFTTEVVDDFIVSTMSSILDADRGGIISVGFVLALWAGSTAINSLVGSTAVAHGQHHVRGRFRQRVFAVSLSLLGLLVAVVTLPLIAIGPDLVTAVLPGMWRVAAETTVGVLYYPTVGTTLVLALTTFYRLALPRPLPWLRLLPGATLAVVVFILVSAAMRFYITTLSATSATYGALATVVAFLLFAFGFGMSVVVGAELNNAIDETWPTRPGRRLLGPRRVVEIDDGNGSSGVRTSGSAGTGVVPTDPAR